MAKTKLALALFIISLAYSCLLKPPVVLQYGGVLESDYIDTVNVELRNRLIIVPVTIKGKSYRFLFDTGAPFSISREIQDEFDFKLISKGNIIDSDNNREKVDYVSVGNTIIGKTEFIDQTAFVADFKANAVLNCFEIDGIVGSNLIRHADWLIDMSNKQILFGSDLNEFFQVMEGEQTFNTDFQYDIELDLQLGSDVFKKIKLDYGSNGGLDLPRIQFQSLENHHLIHQGYEIIGEKQTGLLGEVVQSERKLSISDSLLLGDLQVNDIEVQIGGNDVIGTQALEKLVVGINFNEKKIHFSPSLDYDKPFRTYGFYSGHSDEKEVYVLAVFKGTAADSIGLNGGMQIMKANQLDFENGSNFCDYVDLLGKAPDSLILEVVDDSLERRKVVLSYSILE
ncbi:MAG: hypothetical protein CMP59_01455 [Flavobacteriales bacterium]|nr:hypothetical protein [Flavobacteriales bacterium]